LTKIPELTDEQLDETVAALKEAGSVRGAARLLGIDPATVRYRRNRAAERGMLGTGPVMPGYRLASIAEKVGGKWIKQVKAPGEVFEIPPTHVTGKITVNRDADGRVIQDWLRVEPDKDAQLAAMRAAVEAFKEEIPRTTALTPPSFTNAKLLNQYTITDLHFGSLSWHEETGDADYDLAIAERLLMDWFTAAIQLAPRSKRAVLAQLGDWLHHDSHESVTPARRHQIDSDSRLQKVIRAVIRCVRRIIAMLLEKHDEVHVVMADANHDPASEAWLREMLAAFYEDEPRLTVEQSADTYYAVEHGQVSLFYHHSHRRQGAELAATLTGKFREIFGRTKFSYAHTGHRHSDELVTTPMMIVERHETLAAASKYDAHGGWISGRSAKVIAYHEDFGEVYRSRLTPEMVAGMSAANDNQPKQERAAA
jgi:AcrR family transcriptional regulator